MVTHELIEKNGEVVAIKCKVCGLTSWSLEDVKYKYCVFCDMFHDSHEIQKKEIIKSNKNKVWKLKLKQYRSKMYTQSWLMKAYYYLLLLKEK